VVLLDEMFAFNYLFALCFVGFYVAAELVDCFAAKFCVAGFAGFD
jgi:hypothetical protein